MPSSVNTVSARPVYGGQGAAGRQAQTLASQDREALAAQQAQQFEQMEADRALREQLGMGELGIAREGLGVQREQLGVQERLGLQQDTTQRYIADQQNRVEARRVKANREMHQDTLAESRATRLANDEYRNRLLEIKKLTAGAEVGLVEAQTAQALAGVEAMGAQTRMAEEQLRQLRDLYPTKKASMIFELERQRAEEGRIAETHSEQMKLAAMRAARINYLQQKSAINTRLGELTQYQLAAGASRDAAYARELQKRLQGFLTTRARDASVYNAAWGAYISPLIGQVTPELAEKIQTSVDEAKASVPDSYDNALPELRESFFNAVVSKVSRRPKDERLLNITPWGVEEMATKNYKFDDGSIYLVHDDGKTTKLDGAMLDRFYRPWADMVRKQKVTSAKASASGLSQSPVLKAVSDAVKNRDPNTTPVWSAINSVLVGKYRSTSPMTKAIQAVGTYMDANTDQGREAAAKTLRDLSEQEKAALVTFLEVTGENIRGTAGSAFHEAQYELLSDERGLWSRGPDDSKESMFSAAYMKYGRGLMDPGAGIVGLSAVMSELQNDFMDKKTWTAITQRTAGLMRTRKQLEWVYQEAARRGVEPGAVDPHVQDLANALEAQVDQLTKAWDGLIDKYGGVAPHPLTPGFDGGRPDEVLNAALLGAVPGAR